MTYIFRFLVVLLSCQTLFSQTEFNSFDDKGKKHGIWKGVYQESGRSRYEGVFDHGKETGIFNFFDDTKAKSIIATRAFRPKENACYTIFYDQKKNIVSEGKEIGRLHEGQWKYYHHESKTPMIVENYKNGKLEGLRTVYYSSGKILEEALYVNGLKEGVYKKYSEAGIIIESAFFKNGEYDGLAVYKDPNDSIIAKGIFRNDKKVGKWEFFVNGKKTSEENMDKPKKPMLKSDKIKID